MVNIGKNLLLIIISFTLFSSCGYNRLYNGPTLPKEEVAFLITYCEGFFEMADVNIESVDGQQVKKSVWDRSVKIELLPGTHEVVARFHRSLPRGYLYSINSCTLKFYAEPGHTYLLRANSKFFTWSPEIDDITSIRR